MAVNGHRVRFFRLGCFVEVPAGNAFIRADREGHVAEIADRLAVRALLRSYDTARVILEEDIVNLFDLRRYRDRFGLCDFSDRSKRDGGIPAGELFIFARFDFRLQKSIALLHDLPGNFLRLLAVLFLENIRDRVGVSRQNAQHADARDHAVGISFRSPCAYGNDRKEHEDGHENRSKLLKAVFHDGFSSLSADMLFSVT